MRLEPGKYYRTQNGRKALVYAIWPNNTESDERVHGAVKREDEEEWEMHEWAEDGTWWHGSKTNGWNIVAEWGKEEECTCQCHN